MLKVLIPLAKGFEEIEAICMIDVLRRGGLDVIIAGVGTSTVTGAHQIEVVTQCLVSEVKSEELEMIVLPGGWDGTKNLAEDADVQRLLQEMDAKKKMIGAICAAPYALHRAGVLKHHYTCYPSVEKDIRTEGYTADQEIVTDGNVMTSRGPGTALCFALAIVERLKDSATAKRLDKAMLLDCF